MTAVQQFILVEPEVYLVSGIYPVRQIDLAPMTSSGALTGSFFFRVPTDVVAYSHGSLVSVDLVNIGRTNVQAEPGVVSYVHGAMVSSTFSSIGQVSGVYSAVDNLQSSGAMVSGTMASNGQVLYYYNELDKVTSSGVITDITKT